MKYIQLSILFFTLFAISCQQELSEKEKQTYTSKGKEIAKATFKIMGGEVTKMMQKGGVAKAAPYCNAHAENITKEVADKYDVIVKRTSDKLRNEDNIADEEETAIIANYKKQLANGQKIKPLVKKDLEGKPHFYAPIKIKKKCLTCHGVLGKTMEHEADSIIKTLYPNDRATGFREGDLRGIWSIQFKK